MMLHSQQVCNGWNTHTYLPWSVLEFKEPRMLCDLGLLRDEVKLCRLLAIAVPQILW